MRAVARLSLSEYIDRGMRLARTNAVRVEKETGVPASWTRQLKAGRLGGGADRERVASIARALGLDEAEIWTYLGRMDLVAALRTTHGWPTEGKDQPTEGGGGSAATSELVAALRDQIATLDRQAAALERQNELVARLIGVLAQAAAQGQAERQAISDRVDEAVAILQRTPIAEANGAGTAHMPPAELAR